MFVFSLEGLELVSGVHNTVDTSEVPLARWDL